MQVRIVSAFADCWYKEQIGSIFNVQEGKGMDDKPCFFVCAPEKSLWYIRMEDCEILPEENQPEPFDLERALKGEKVIGCSGDEGVFIFTNHNSFDGDKHLFQFSVKNSGDQYVLVFNGTGWQGGFTGIKHDSSIFMAPRESEYVTKWVNVFDQRVTDDTIRCSNVYDSKEKAAANSVYYSNESGFIGTLPITFKRPS